MLRKLLITLVLAGMLFFWGCSSGGGKSGSSDDPGGDNHTTIPDSSGNVDDILPLSNKYVVLSKDSVSLYVGESFDIAILKNEYALELSVSVDDEFVADAEINGDIVTVAGDFADQTFPVGLHMGQVGLCAVDLALNFGCDLNHCAFP